MKNIYIYILLFLTMVLFSGKANAYGTDPSFNNDTQRQLDCLRKIYWGQGYIQSGTSNSINNSTLAKDTTSIKNSAITSASGMETIEIKSGSNLTLLIKDLTLSDYVFKIVVMFGVGYMVARSLFKR